MKRVWSWLTSNIGGLSILFFLAFIPLYPKLPLINVIRTWVYIRLEDFLVAAAIGVYILARVRLKALPETPLTWPIIAYWTIGIVSAAYSIAFIGPKLEGYFPHLVILHYLRRIEYMMLFFMAFDVARRSKSFVSAVIWTLAGTTAGIIVYGFGQKLYGWPAFLTMNEEFAKGIPLRLPPTARIPSTFGGHYDLAAFMVLTIPILVTFIFAAKKIWQKAIFLVLSVGSLGMLLLTESRTSFLVYLVGITATLIWYRKKLWIIPVIILSFYMLNLVKGATDRFYKTFRFSDIIVDLSTGKPVGTLASLEGGTAVIQKSESPATENLPTGSQYIGLPQTASAAAQVKTISYTSVPLASGSGEIATVSGSFLIQKALVYDISITTRLQGEWPGAITAFKRNILLGSGYSTLSIAADGDYIRMLGETGILGTIGFLGILLAAYVLFLRRKESLAGYDKAFVVGVFGGLTGLMFNGILIDVFEASKVAFSLWLLLGVAMAVITSAEMSFRQYLALLRRALTSNIAYLGYLFVTVIVLFGNSVSNYFVADDFTWLKWAAGSSYADVMTYFTSAAGFFYRPIPKLVYFLLYAVFWLKPEGYHIVSILLYGIVAFLVYRLMTLTGVKRSIALLAGILFAALSVHHENVFWVSGLSSLLSALFLLASVVSYRFQAYHRSWRKILWLTASIVCMVLAMFSYDGMIVAPIILCITAWLTPSKKSWRTFLPLLAIPLYWLVRSYAGAVAPSGDYGYRLSTLPFNVLGNGVGYFISTFLGPRFVESWGSVREYLRLHRLVAGLSGTTVAAVFAVVLWKFGRLLYGYRSTIVWILCGFVSLAAYLGLGAMSERYDLAASGFFIAALGSWVSVVWGQRDRAIWKYGAVVVMGGLIIWNAAEVTRVSGDWQKATSVSQETLSIMSKQFFPLRENKSFIFINTPIRYGRAWIFPTGLADALWHVFRFNPWDFATTNASTPDAAYQIPVRNGFAAEIFIFEDYHLKKLIKVVK
jgi:hypothetical protein